MSRIPSGPMTAADADPTGQSASSARRSMVGLPVVIGIGGTAGNVAGECASIGGVVDTAAERAIVLFDDAADVTGRDPLLDIAIGPALLQRIAAAGEPETLRFYRPLPTLA